MSSSQPADPPLTSTPSETTSTSLSTSTAPPDLISLSGKTSSPLSIRSLSNWYHNSPGVANLRQLLLYNNYEDETYEPRTRYQIDRYEQWKDLTGWGVFFTGTFSAIKGWQAGSEQFREVKQLAMYENTVKMHQSFIHYSYMGALGYCLPVMIRAGLVLSSITAAPMLVGVYRNDTDRVWHYTVCGAVGGFLHSCLHTGTDWKGWRAKCLAMGAVSGFATLIGLYNILIQKYEFYPHYDKFAERRKARDPVWQDFLDSR